MNICLNYVHTVFCCIHTRINVLLKALFYILKQFMCIIEAIIHWGPSSWDANFLTDSKLAHTALQAESSSETY